MLLFWLALLLLLPVDVHAGAAILAESSPTGIQPKLTAVPEEPLEKQKKKKKIVAKTDKLIFKFCYLKVPKMKKGMLLDK